MTAKGELVRAILYPKSKNKMLQSDLLKNIILFFIITAPVMIFSAYCFMRFEASRLLIFLRVDCLNKTVHFFF